MSLLDRYRSFIPDWDAFIDSTSRREPTVFRVRRGRVDPSEVKARLEGLGFRLEPVRGLPDFMQVVEQPYPVTFTYEHWAGLIYVQQASTGVAAPALGPRPGERVLDMCAAPGGKAAHLSELMEGRGCLVASDASDPRIRGLLGNLYRLGHTNILVVNADGRDFPDDACFDRVLVDAPCSGEGTVRRRKGELPTPSHGFLRRLHGIQDALLRRAIRLTRPGGTILYATCTFAPEENEAIVDAVLRDAPVELEPLALEAPHEPGLTSFDGARYDPALEGAARIYPHQLDSGGLFLARLRRLDDGDADRGWGPVPSRFPSEDTWEGDPSGATPATEDEVAAMVERGTRGLQEHFGVPAEVLESVRWIERGGRLWLHTVPEWPLEQWSPGAWRPISMGFRALEFDSRGRPRVTNDLLQWLGGAVGSARYPLDPDDLDTVLAGRTLPSETDEPGHFALTWEGRVLGRGVATRGVMRPEIPRARRKDLARIVEHRRQARPPGR